MDTLANLFLIAVNLTLLSGKYSSYFPSNIEMAMDVVGRSSSKCTKYNTCLIWWVTRDMKQSCTGLD